MRKLITSLVVVGAVTTALVVGTQALFSDTEESTGNTFTTGTIDIAVDGENPWESTGEYGLYDMKPSYTDYIEFWVENVGTNPLNLWKTLQTYEYRDVNTSEPECDAEGGTWNANICIGGTEVNDIGRFINYDMRVELYPINAQEPVWWETIYTDEDDFTLGELMNQKMYLGMIPVGWRLRVIQSYHMTNDAGNEYQGDGMDFDISLYAEQLTNTVRLVHKYEANTDVSHHVWDGTYADFSYKVMDVEMNWDLATTGVADGDYTLLVWDDSDIITGDGTAYNWDWSERSEAVVLALLNDSGNQTHNGTWDPDYDVENAKVWLVPGHHGAVGGSAGNFPWFATTTYFETGLIDFYDSL